MGRSIYCSKCKKEKEVGRDNESCCRICKLAAEKERRAKKREQNGLPAYGSGRSAYCCCCKGAKENPKQGYCYSCKRIKQNERDIATGAKKQRAEKCACGKDFDSNSKSYCKECLATKRKARIRPIITPEQKARWADLQRKRYKHKIRKKERLDPLLWEKQVRVGKKERVDGKKVCGRPNCSNTENLLPNNWCRSCHAAYQRERRKYFSPIEKTEEQKIRHRVRALTRMYIKYGRLIKQPCEACGEIKVDAHHDDYDKPLDVRWLCKIHHREYHKLFPNL